MTTVRVYVHYSTIIGGGGGGRRRRRLLSNQVEDFVYVGFFHVEARGRGEKERTGLRGSLL